MFLSSHFGYIIFSFLCFRQIPLYTTYTVLIILLMRRKYIFFWGGGGAGKVERQILYCKLVRVFSPHMVADLLGSHLWLLDHKPGLCVVGNGLDDLAGHPHHVLQHPSWNLHLRKEWFFCMFWRTRVCWPLLCSCRLFCIFEICLDSNPESCRSKQARYQISHPIPN